MNYIADNHGDLKPINDWINNYENERYLCILGDSGVNFYEDNRDIEIKKYIQKEITKYRGRTHNNRNILFVRGNHEARPDELKTYKRVRTCIGQVFVEDDYPDLWFLIDGESYKIEGKYYFVLGGGFSIDGFDRILNNYRWWKHEELSDREFNQIMIKAEETIKHPIIVLSHMLPSEVKNKKRSKISNTEKNLQSFLEKYHQNIIGWNAGHDHRRETIYQRGMPFEIVYKKITKLNEKDN